MTGARLIVQRLGALFDRVRRDESGAELVQIAIGVVVAVVMGTLLLAAVNLSWPEIISAALDRVRDLVSG